MTILCDWAESSEPKTECWARFRPTTDLTPALQHPHSDMSKSPRDAELDAAATLCGFAAPNAATSEQGYESPPSPPASKTMSTTQNVTPRSEVMTARAQLATPPHARRTWESTFSTVVEKHQRWQLALRQALQECTRLASMHAVQHL